MVAEEMVNKLVSEAMKLTDYLCCPNCKKDLIEKNNHLSCKSCQIDYIVKSGIPILLNPKGLSSQNKKQIDYFSVSRDVIKKKYELEEWHKSFLNRFFENFSNLKKKLVLDCGVGQGYMTIELAKKGAYVIAFDLTYEWLVRLKKITKQKKLEDRILFVCCSAELLPIKDKKIDYLISNALLEHLEKEKEAVAEIDRVCKNQAGLMITTPLQYRFVNPLFVPFYFLQDKVIGHLRRYDNLGLKKIFCKFKFQFKNVYYTGHIFKVIIIKLFIEVFGLKKLEKFGENVDRKSEKKKFGASSICIFFEREFK